MGLLDCAGGTSMWRGYDCFQENKVKSLFQLGDGILSANVVESANKIIPNDFSKSHGIYL